MLKHERCSLDQHLVGSVATWKTVYTRAASVAKQNFANSKLGLSGERNTQQNVQLFHNACRKLVLL